MKRKLTASPDTRVYLVGGGIGSLASAFYLIRDAGVAGHNIHVLEQDDILGGALDGAGDPDNGFLIRGGRMHEEHFVCYWDLLSNIPSYDDPNVSVRDESFEFNARLVSHARARLLENGEKLDRSSFQLSMRDQVDLLRLSLSPEKSLDNIKIQEWFQDTFFETNFWYLWQTMFAFQKWSGVAAMRRYMRRFIHLVEGLPILGGVMRTRYDQYHSVVVPLQRYLQDWGVQFQLGTQVVDIDFIESGKNRTAKTLYLGKGDTGDTIELNETDVVFITNGSITDATSCGSWDEAPVIKDKSAAGSWLLWENIASKGKGLGNPGVFSDNIHLQKWYSFTTTLKDGRFHDHMRDFTGNEHGTGGLVTLTDSNWLMSIVIAHQPHFPNQPDDVKVFWGYGLYPDREGNFVNKKMSDCSGREILDELWHHLKVNDLMQPIAQAGKINCIPVAMPFIDSLFMPCARGDRPKVIPKGARNFAFLGQFAQVPKDCVFTVEYSVRTAQTAVYGLFDTDRRVLPVHDSIHQPAVLLDALQAIAR